MTSYRPYGIGRRITAFLRRCKGKVHRSLKGTFRISV
jgi:hypothetical protein